MCDKEVYLLFSWVCLRAARETAVASANGAQLSGTLCASGDDLPLLAHNHLPAFVTSDLLKPCGGIDVMNRGSPQVSVDTDPSQEASGGPQLTWVHLAHYQRYLAQLLSISRPAVCEEYGGLMSLAEDVGVCLRLWQLQAFFSAHLPSYTHTCTGPSPPNNLLLHPQLLQAKEPQSRPEPYPWAPPLDPYSWAPPSDPPPQGPPSNPHPWASASRPELILLWHHPALDPSVSKGQILLYYAVNQLPVSARCPVAAAVEGLRVGQRLVCLDKLQALHAQLSAACVDGMEAPAAPPSGTTPTNAPLKKADAGATTSPKQQMLKEKTKLCCAEIRRLLSPQAKSASTAEVPFEASLQTLRDLEQSFDPSQGATLVNKGLITWLLTLLCPTEGGI